MITKLFESELGTKGVPTIQALIHACPEQFRNRQNVWYATARRLRGCGADMSNWVFKHPRDSQNQQLVTNLTILTVTSRDDVHDLNSLVAWFLSEALEKPPEEILRPAVNHNRAKLHSG